MTVCRQIRRRRQSPREPRKPPGTHTHLKIAKVQTNSVFPYQNLKEAALLQKNTILFYSCLHRNTCPGDTKSQRYSHHVHCACQLCPWPLTGTVTQGAAHSLSSLSSCTAPRMPGELLFSHSAAFVSGQVWSTQKEVIM